MSPRPAKNIRYYGHSYQELAAALIVHHGIHDGQWKIALKFGQTGWVQAHFQQYPGKPIIPSAIVPVMEIALARHEGDPDSLCVDAAKVNPAPHVQPATPEEVDLVTGGPRH